MSYEKISKTLESGSKEEKIATLESLANSNQSETINKIISILDDPDIEVRGEAFASLVLNQNDISRSLIQNLNSESKNIRGYTALILANRKNPEGIPQIAKLTKDQSSMVRSCALGALGYLKAQKASKEIHSCFSDSNLEVKKSALKAAIDIGDKVPEEEIKEFSKEHDPELDKLVVEAKKNL